MGVDLNGRHGNIDVRLYRVDSGRARDARPRWRLAGLAVLLACQGLRRRGRRPARRRPTLIAGSAIQPRATTAPWLELRSRREVGDEESRIVVGVGAGSFGCEPTGVRARSYNLRH